MIKKSLFATFMVAMMFAFATPAQAQFKGLGKSLGKAAKDAGKAAQEMATDAAMDKAAITVSDKMVEFMDKNNTVVAEDSDYAKRLTSILGSKFASVDGKDLVIKIYENEEANILALHNGNIRLYSGMLDLLDDSEVKALIALQAAHIQTNNVRDNLMKAATGESAESAGSAQVEKLLAFSGDKIGSVINEVIQLPYTKEQNAAADKFAKDYLKKEGGNVDGFNSLLTKIQALSKVDLDEEDLDEEDDTVIEATIAAKFVGVNKLR